MIRKQSTTLAVLAAAAALSLSACDRGREERTAGQRVDEAVAKVEQKADEAKAAAKDAAQDVRQATNAAIDGAANKALDAAITTSVNAALVRDSELSAGSINVDTVDGRVALRGSAPDVASRERATTLAMRVDGVKSVDNQLAVKPKG